jgi:hypothetical protein
MENGPPPQAGPFAAPREKEIAGEQRRPRALGNETDRQVELRVRTSGEVHQVAISAGQMIDDVAVEPGEGIRRHWLVDAPPPDLVRYLAVPHNEFVPGGAAGVGAGFDDECAGIGKSSFATTNCVLDQHSRRQVAVIRARNSTRLSLHRETTRLLFTIGILDHQSNC